MLSCIWKRLYLGKCIDEMVRKCWMYDVGCWMYDVGCMKQTLSLKDFNCPLPIAH